MATNKKLMLMRYWNVLPDNMRPTAGLPHFVIEHGLYLIEKCRNIDIQVSTHSNSCEACVIRNQKSHKTRAGRLPHRRNTNVPPTASPRLIMISNSDITAKETIAMIPSKKTFQGHCPRFSDTGTICPRRVPLGDECNAFPKKTKSL